MKERKWRDALARPRDYKLWPGAIPGTRDEVWTFNIVTQKAQEEEDKEKRREERARKKEKRREALAKAGELFIKATQQGRVRVEPAVTEAIKPKKKRGRPLKEPDYVKILHDIRDQNPGSDGKTEFKQRLITHPDKALRAANERTAQRRYLRADRALAEEKRKPESQ